MGGIELMLPWPEHLPTPEGLALDEEREASRDERAWAESRVRESCEAHGLVPVHVRAACILPPQGQTPAAYLAVTIIGVRWVHASTSRAPRIMFGETS